MSNSGCTVNSLYNLSMNTLYYSINEDTIKYICKWYPPSITLNILWKLLHVNNDDDEFVYNFSLHNINQRVIERGWNIFELKRLFIIPIWQDVIHGQAVGDIYIPNEQISFDNRHHICEQFDLNLFFKLVKVTQSRNKLYTIFQICIRKKGYDLPKLLANEWIEKKKNNVNDIIKHGLELGIFLGDTGWFRESALVLSYTYKKINNKWAFFSQNLKLIQTVQCLTKWLIVVTNYYNFEEAKVVVQYMKNTIHVIEKIKGRTLSIAYSYYAVSQYYYMLMNYNKAWLWIIKSVNELNNESDSLKLLVISHTVKLCGVMNKISIGLKLMNRLYKYKKEIDQNVLADIIMNQSYYYLRSKLQIQSTENCFIAIDIMRNLFGYNNLLTAITFINYIQALSHFNLEKRCGKAISAILQAMYILKNLDLPDDNMLTLFSEQMGSSILPLNIYAQQTRYFSNTIVKDVKIINLKILDISLKVAGKKSLFTAKSYCNLAKFYKNQGNYTKSEEMYLKEIKLKELILGKESPDVAYSLDLLANLYTRYLKKFQEAEQLCLRSMAIYETLYGPKYCRLIDIFELLANIYFVFGQKEKKEKYFNLVYTQFDTTVSEISVSEIHEAIHKNSKKDQFSLEEIKCVLNV